MVLNPVISKLCGKLVVLASASPRRLEILTNVGLRFEVVPSWFKETLDKREFRTHHDYAVETAKQKALEVAKRMPFKHLKTPDIVIGADTVVTVDGLILEKPVDKQDAYNMLSRLSGKEHIVCTGVAIILCHEKEDQEIDYEVIDFYEETKVKFADLSEDLLWEYINSGEPMDKAGGYGIQALGGMLVEYVHGDFLNVVGFPLNHFCKQLDRIYNSSPVNSPPVNKLSKCSENGDALDRSNHALPQGGAMPWRNVVEPESSDYSKEGFPHHIAELMDGFKASKALFVASRLGVFDTLKRPKAMSATEVAVELGASVEGMERLLEACSSLGLLEASCWERGKPVFRNTEATNCFLATDSPLSLHGYIRHCDTTVWPLFTQLEHAVTEGTNQKERTLEERRDLSQDASDGEKKVKLRFMNAMHSIATVTGKDVATAFDLSQFKTACDLGGCTGAMAYEFARAHPGLSVTVFDLPAVIDLTDHFLPHDPNSRVSFVAGDFLKDELPKADLYILARVLHDLSDEKLDALLSKLSDACIPGDVLLVSESVLDEERRRPVRVVLQALSLSAGRQRSASEYCGLLRKHGFTHTTVKYTNNFLDAILSVRE